MDRFIEEYNKVNYLFEEKIFEYDLVEYTLKDFINKNGFKNTEIGYSYKSLNSLLLDLQKKHNMRKSFNYMLEYFDTITALFVQIREMDEYFPEDVEQLIDDVLYQIDCAMDIIYK